MTRTVGFAAGLMRHAVLFTASFECARSAGGKGTDMWMDPLLLAVLLMVVCAYVMHATAQGRWQRGLANAVFLAAALFFAYWMV